MKPIYLEYTELSIALAEIAQRCDLDLLATLSDQTLIQRQKVSNVTELMEILNSEESLFGETSDSPILVDIQNIELSAKLIEIIASCESLSPIFISSSIDDSLDTDTKKTCKKLALEVLTLKKLNPEIAKSTARVYSNELELKANAKKIEDLAAQCISYFEIIDSLDFVALADDQNSAIDSMLKPFKLQLFMRGFNLNSLSIKEIQPWVKDVDEGELQLALSLIFTKLSKLDSTLSKKLLQELILTDQRIKTRAKISPLIWYRLFLYKCMEEV
jgi:hypothetical protein